MRSYRFLIPLGLVTSGAILLAAGWDVNRLQVWLEKAGIWAPAMFVLTGIPLMSTLLPKTALSLVAGALFGTLVGSGLMLMIAVAAAILNYAIGRWWLHDSILRRLEVQSRADNRSWPRAVHRLAADSGLGFHLLIRLSPIPTMLISYAMGAVGARRVPYLSAAALAVIPQMLWIHGGTLIRAAGENTNSDLHWISGGLALLAAIAISVIVPRGAMRRIREISH